ncbi:hypothetical protein TNCV_3660791 [Trichonephila clavipes]|nr:hypothetical protein TNCV_3660791 [Trichonephila clavipes]
MMSSHRQDPEFRLSWPMPSNAPGEMVRGHGGNLRNERDRADQRGNLSWNAEFLTSPKALWTKKFFRSFIDG